MNNPLPADEYDSDTLMSYQEWKDAGYYVLKGSKSRERDCLGICHFSIDQTTAREGLKYNHTTSYLEQRLSDRYENCDATEADIY